jgi:transcriptional regulator with XRE-family HTH domain
MAPGGHPSARRVLADNLRLMRVMRRLSQTVLAEKPALVSAIERGRANPTVESLERLAMVLGVRWANCSTIPKALSNAEALEPAG